MRSCIAPLAAAGLLAAACALLALRARPSGLPARLRARGTLSWAQPPELDRCGQWASSGASLRAHMGALGVPNSDRYGWTCAFYSVQESMRASAAPGRPSANGKAVVSLGECSAWCEAKHNPKLYVTSEWCCHWEPTAEGGGTEGTCSWADGLAQFERLPDARCVPETAAAPGGCAEPLAYEACALKMNRFQAVEPGVEDQKLSSHRGPVLGAAEGERPARVRFAERGPVTGCKEAEEEDRSHVLNSTDARTVGTCAEDCAGLPGGACAAFAFSAARAERAEPGSCRLLSHCRDERGAPQNGWASWRRASEQTAARARADPLQAGAPLGTAARHAGGASARGARLGAQRLVEPHDGAAPCAPSNRRFVMDGEGKGTCSQLCLEPDWWEAAARHGARAGECRANGCAEYLASRAQAGRPFDLYACRCPAGNRSALYSCHLAGAPALT